MIDNCLNSFPNTTELTLTDNNGDLSKWSENDSLHRIIPLAQLTKLTINYGYRPFNKVIDMLYLTPNIHTLVLKCVSLVATDFLPLQRSERFQLVSSTNKIKNMTILCDYSLHKIKLLINLCPKLEHLAVRFTFKSYDALEPIIQFLLLETNKKTCHLSSLCIFEVSMIEIEKLKTVIESEKILNNYSMKVFDRMFFLWW